MFGLTMSLALETASKHITTNTVTPGFATTDMIATIPAAAMDKIVARIPVGRLSEPGEVARVVEFLADPESAYITARSTRSTAACTYRQVPARAEGWSHGHAGHYQQ